MVLSSDPFHLAIATEFNIVDNKHQIGETCEIDLLLNCKMTSKSKMGSASLGVLVRHVRVALGVCLSSAMQLIGSLLETRVQSACLCAQHPHCWVPDAVSISARQMLAAIQFKRFLDAK